MLLRRRCRGHSSEKLYDLAPDIPDVMGLRALRPSAAVVKVMSVPDSRCIRVVTPDNHINIGFHEILLHDMGEEDLLFVATSELDYLRRSWPRALFVFMSRYQQDLEHMRMGFGRTHCFLPHRTRTAVALSDYVVHGVEGDCSGLY